MSDSYFCIPPPGIARRLLAALIAGAGTAYAATLIGLLG